MALVDLEDDDTITSNCDSNNHMKYTQEKDSKLRKTVTSEGEKYSAGSKQTIHMEEQRQPSKFHVEPETPQDKSMNTNGSSSINCILHSPMLRSLSSVDNETAAAQATAKEQQTMKESTTTTTLQDSSPLSRKPEARLLSLAEIRAGREARAGEALRLKDEQLRILQEQNTTLLAGLDKVEEEATQMQRERLAVDEAKHLLDEKLVQSQTQERAIKASLERAIIDNEEKDKQLHIMTSQNAELLRLLEVEEEIAGKLSAEKEAASSDLEDLKIKYRNAMSAAKEQEELAGKSSREGRLLSEEVGGGSWWIFTFTINVHPQPTSITLRYILMIIYANAHAPRVGSVTQGREGSAMWG